jgi:hypothetical protein
MSGFPAYDNDYGLRVIWLEYLPFDEPFKSIREF